MDSTILERDECNEELTAIVDEHSGFEDIGFLARSPNRFNLLVTLHHSSRCQTALQQQLNLPQPTLRRILLELEDHNWIEELPTENRYRLLPAGQIAMRTFSMAVETMEVTNRLGRFLDQLPLSVPVDTPVLGDCEITVCTPRAPYAPVYSLLELVQTADTLKSVSPVVDPMTIDPLVEQIANGLTFEFVGTNNALDQLQTTHSSAFRTLSNAESAQFLVADEVQRCAINLVGDSIAIMTYDYTMRPDSLLVADNDQHQIANWAEQQYLSHVDIAEIYR